MDRATRPISITCTTDIAQRDHVPLVPFLLESVALNPRLHAGGWNAPECARAPLILDHCVAAANSSTYTRIEIHMDRIWLKSYPPGVPAEINVGEFRSLKEIAEQSFQKFADADAYVQMGRTMTYAELDHTSRHFAAWLQKTAASEERRPARHHAA